MEQLEFYEEQRITAEAHMKKSVWERAFQKWSNAKSQEPATDQGKCGYGVMCDLCGDCSYGSPCVRALNAWLRERGMRIDYNKAEPEDVWRGNI